MAENELKHYGRQGMKWYQHIYGEYQGGAKYAKKGKETSSEKSKSSTGKIRTKKSVKRLTDEELDAAIKRLTKEKDYLDLVAKTSKKSAGASFVAGILAKSGKNIAEQYVTYWLGTAVNKAHGENIVNPKKGQKKD